MNLSHVAPLVRDSQLRRQLGTYILARLPSGMLVLALLLYANERLGALSQAGAVVATYTITVAVIAPAVGRLADRNGARRVLPLAALVHVCGIATIVVTHSLGLMCAGAVAAGAGLPPTAACLRARWRHLRDPTRATVYTVDGIIVEAAHVVGPLIVALLTAAFAPSAAVAAATGCSAVAAVITAVLSPGTPTAHTGPRHWIGPLRFATVDLLLVVLGTVTAAIAIIEVSVVSFASERHKAALAGVLFAAMAAGSTLGGVAFAARGTRRPPRDLLTQLCMVSAAGFALLFLARGSSTWLLFVLLAISNLAIAPLFATLYSFLSEVAPDGETAETFTWLSSSNFVAIAGGTALGGVLLTRTDRWCAYGVAVGLLAGAAATAYAARRVAAAPAPVLPDARADN